MFLVAVFSPDATLERNLRANGDYFNSGSESDSSPSSPFVLSTRPLPDSFEIGDHIVADLPPGVFKRTSFNVQRNSFVQFNLTVEPRAKLALYGRQTLPPSPTEYDFSQIILGAKLHASPIKRSALKPQDYQYPDRVR